MSLVPVAARAKWLSQIRLEQPSANPQGEERMIFPRRSLRWALGLELLSAAWTFQAQAAAEPTRFLQDRFAIGFWVPPAADQDQRARYQEIADAHFNVVIGSAGKAAAQLELCRELGLKAIVGVSANPADLPEGPACWGYLLTDEPGAAVFPELSKRVQQIRQDRPGRLAYINLFPNYANAAQLGTPTYEEHVSRFMNEVRPDVLSMDHYPLMRPNADRRDAYCANLETFRRHSLSAGIPFWNYFHSMPFADRLDPTEAQIRWQINASIAYGAKGVLYFCYWTPGKGNGGTGEFPKGGALLTAEGRKTRHYDEARRINAELKVLGPTLMKLTSTGVLRVKTGPESARLLAGSPLVEVEAVKGDPVSELIVGTFRHSDGRRAVWIVNHSYAYTAWPTVRLSGPLGALKEVSKVDGMEMDWVDDSPELPGWQLSLGPGEGRLFLLP